MIVGNVTSDLLSELLELNENLRLNIALAAHNHQSVPHSIIHVMQGCSKKEGTGEEKKGNRTGRYCLISLCMWLQVLFSAWRLIILMLCPDFLGHSRLILRHYLRIWRWHFHVRPSYSWHSCCFRHTPILQPVCNLLHEPTNKENIGTAYLLDTVISSKKRIKTLLFVCIYLAITSPAVQKWQLGQ
jgi:hypothetical protein